MTDIAARARIASWKQALLDPSDPLLDLGEASIPLLADPVRLAFSLTAGGGFACEGQGGDGGGFERGVLRASLAPLELERRLGELRRAGRDAAASAEHVTWLGLGLVTWCDAAGKARCAPLWLLPVDLERGETGLRVVAGGDRVPRLNLALVDRMREAGVALELADPRDLAAVLDAVAAAIEGRDGWRLDRAVRLGVFSLVALALWRDLEALGELATRAPIAWLAGGSIAPPFAPALPAGDADVVAPLDADAGQLAVVAAAGAGGTFIVQGPPGSGKSQTIANLVVHCATAGKSVLVVSDRASALDTVHGRLAAIGLGDSCLPLHGAAGGRTRVLGALGRVLDRAFRPGAVAGNDARRAELRGALDAYATALHAVGPFGISIHAALGRLVELRTTPRAALAEPDAPGLDRMTFERRKAAVAALAAATAPVEPIASHPWRMSALRAWSDDGTERATRALDEALSAADGLADVLATVAAAVPGLIARTPDQLRQLGTLADLAASSPRPGAELLAARAGRNDEVGEQVALIRARGGGTIEPPRDPATFLALAQRHRALVDELTGKLSGDPSPIDAGELWSQLKRWHRGMAPLRFVALRTARAVLRAIARPDALATDEDLLLVLEALIAERACRAALLAAAEPARRWFGDLGRAADPLAFDLAKIEAAFAWATELRHAFDQIAVGGGEAGRQTAWRSLVAQVIASADDRTELRVFVRLADAQTRWECALTELAAATGIDGKLLGAGPDHVTALRDQVVLLRGTVGTFAAWTKFQLARRAALVEGVGAAVPAIERGDLTAADLAEAWERATLLAWAASEQRALPALARFDGGAHHGAVTMFAELDKMSLAAAKAGALARLAERVPRARAADPEVALLRRELAAEDARPVREVLGGLPTLLPRLTPCVLATPRAIAELLDPALPPFDLVVFDEASRLPMGHALGALARATAAVIVGDSRQLVPADGEGLLAAAVAAGWPELRLSGHYRSRHEDLFAFANRRYYDDRLVVAPAPARTAELGIAWRRIDGATDDTGANRAEADAIVGELTARLRDPAQCTRSIAVVAMSPAQLAVIEEALDAARAADSALDAALELQRSGGAEPLLVGLPERLQGEERDVVLLSLAHTPDALEPLAQPGWLTVATTRAREQLIVMSSYGVDDLPLEAPTPVRELLSLAAAGGRGAEDATPASPITAAIARALAERGWVVRHRVGCGSYQIDLAVVDPNDPDRYVLAIEHDGAAYAGARGARERDRLRAQQLAQLGWRVQRIWSLDWWVDAEREIHRAHGAIVAAVAATRQKRAPAAPRTRTARGSAPIAARVGSAPIAAAAATAARGSGPTEALPLVETSTQPLRLPRGAIAIGPYTAAAVPCGRRTPDDMFAPRHVGELGKLVEQVLAAEAPIHVELLARRVSAYFGVGKLTPKITDQVREALPGRGKMGDEEGIVWRIDQDPADVPPVRVAGGSATARRAIDEVPLFELAAAARVVVERAHGLSTAELVRDCARLMGFARITDRVTERVSLGVRLAAARGLIALDDDRARLLLG